MAGGPGGLYDSAPVCCCYSEYLYSCGTDPGEGPGRWATRTGAVRWAWRPAARSGGGQRAAPLQYGDPLAVPASLRPRAAASGLGHRASTGTRAGVGSVQGPGHIQSWVSAATEGLTRTRAIWREQRNWPKGHPGAGKLLASWMKPALIQAPRTGLGRSATRTSVGGGAPCTHHGLGALCIHYHRGHHPQLLF